MSFLRQLQLFHCLCVLYQHSVQCLLDACLESLETDVNSTGVILTLSLLIQLFLFFLSEEVISAHTYSLAPGAATLSAHERPAAVSES